MRRHSKRWKQGVTEKITLKDPDLISGNQWGVSDTEVATDIECAIFKEFEAGGLPAGTQSPGLDTLTTAYTVEFVAPVPALKKKQNIHRADGQILHIIDIDYRDGVPFAVCRDLNDPYGMEG